MDDRRIGPIDYEPRRVPRRRPAWLAFAAWFLLGALALITDGMAQLYSYHRSEVIMTLETLTLFQVANIAEAVLWISMGVVTVMFAKAIRRRVTIALVLVAFGISDFVEAATGAWWFPWWLLLWKSACVAYLLAAVGPICLCRRRGAREGKSTGV